MTSRFWIPGLFGGVILFLYSALAWTVLPWNESSLQPFPDEMTLRMALTQVRHPGIYTLPSPGTAANAATPHHGPLVFAAVRPQGITPMGASMAIGLINDIVCALIAAWLLVRTHSLTYWGKVCFITAAGLLSGLAIHIDYWNWFAFPTAYTVVQILDHLTGWFLAALAMARFARTA